ncbi:uncharacterized protein LOC134271862 [Saccostrea cucullata]|uniref:uncharacterized protein LOC134271862 n=1 Tax=Saccostrea cuccullata TaxID=36930 RepID=UPI002ED0B450
MRINDLGTKISKIDKVSENLSLLCNRIENIQSKVGHLEKFTGNLGNSIGEIKKTQIGLKGDVEETVKEIRELKSVNEQLQSKITDLQARSMRDNLLFFGLAEYRGNNRENCASLIDQFCEAELHLYGIKANIERAHRIGRYLHNKTRPIVAKFSNFRVRENVRASAYKLKNTDYSVREQFLREIVEKRKALMPILHSALGQNKKAELKYDKLYISGKLYKGGTIRETEGDRDEHDEDEPVECQTQDT